MNSGRPVASLGKGDFLGICHLLSIQHGEQNVIIEVFILEELNRRERRDGGEGEERGLRMGESEDRDREKGDKRELS